MRVCILIHIQFLPFLYTVYDFIENWIFNWFAITEINSEKVRIILQFFVVVVVAVVVLCTFEIPVIKQLFTNTITQKKE